MSYQIETPAAVKGPRRKGLLGLGILLLLGGVGAGAGLYVTSTSRYESAVKNLQRAPVGCDTQFTFTGTGTFLFYTEIKGKVGKVHGDCANADATYDHRSGSQPRATLTLVDDNGDEVKLDRTASASYDAGGFVGTAIRSLTIVKPGAYVLSVASDDSDFAIAVGRNPKSDADKIRKIALGAAAAGLVLGLLLIVLGLRRRPAPAPSSIFASSFAPSGAPASGYPPAPNPGGFATPGSQPQGYPTGAPPFLPAPQPQPPQSQPPQSQPPPAQPGSWGAPQQ